ncbi:MAG TPA: YdeI/OmpD-associated family protein [Nocardioidaceae bacterium]|nr:YdeI/OmpD-associated family protein [Nocardioidaceae bacterium]
MDPTARFRATLELGGKTATGIHVPDAVVESLGAGRRPPVQVTINGHSYPSTIASMGGRFMLPMSAENRSCAGVSAGDEVDVQLVVDTRPRTVDVPTDLAEALDREADAKRRFGELSYSHQRRYVLSVEGAKQPETRKRRIDKTVAELTG